MQEVSKSIASAAIDHHLHTTRFCSGASISAAVSPAQDFLIAALNKFNLLLSPQKFNSAHPENALLTGGRIPIPKRS
jgi:hypothetical protein